MQCLGAGAYRVTWRVVSADGHPVAGSYVFSIGAAVALAPKSAELPAPSVAEGSAAASDMHAQFGPNVFEAPLVPALFRGLALGALMALTGLLFFQQLTAASRSGAGDRLTMLLAWLAPLLLAAHFALWIMNADANHQLTSDSIAAAASSSVGKMEMWRTGLALLATWALVLARRPRLALIFATCALLVSGASGHSAAIHPAWTTPAKSLHLIGAAAWMGGLLRLITLDRGDGTRFSSEAARVSSVAFVAVFVVAISGLVQSFLFLATPLDLVRSAYGAIILAKIAGMIVLLAFGAHHRYRALPRLAQAGSSRFVSTLRSELAVLSLVILLGGLLAYVPPSMHAVSAANSNLSRE
jgi:copper transport protein